MLRFAKNKSVSLVSIAFALFIASVFMAYQSVNSGNTGMISESALHTIQSSEQIYTGIQAMLAGLFAKTFEVLMQYTSNNLFMAVVVLAFLVELVLLYPSVSIQVKQKKLHIFHKRLINRFQKGEITLSKTKSELHKIYDVNEQIHRRGAVLVLTQILLFFSTIWGLNFLMGNELFLASTWSTLNASLLIQTPSVALSALISLSFLFHSLIKMYYKEREDYISNAQTSLALAFALAGCVTMYAISNLFPVVISIYLITLISFATIRYAFVEQNSKLWNRWAHSELVRMLRESNPSHELWKRVSRWLNHLPVVRHANVHLMEEALSMSLSLLIMVTIL